MLQRGAELGARMAGSALVRRQLLHAPLARKQEEETNLEAGRGAGMASSSEWALHASPLL